MTRTLVLSTIAVIFVIALVMLAQNIGTQLGGGMQEWLVR